jgi:5-methylcytosine-specific restriction protein A
MPERFSFFKPKKPRKREGRPSFRQRYGNDWEKIRLKVLIRDNWQCRRCGRVCQNPREAQVDHVRGLSIGGDHAESNLETLCSKCHYLKSQSERALTSD